MVCYKYIINIIIYDGNHDCHDQIHIYIIKILTMLFLEPQYTNRYISRILYIIYFSPNEIIA